MTEFTGLITKATIPGVRVGEQVEILTAKHSISAEVIGFRNSESILMPYGFAEGIGPDSTVRPTGHSFHILCGKAMIGHVFNGLGAPLSPPKKFVPPLAPWSVDRPPPHPLRRAPISTPLSLGVRAIDGLLTVGKGQRIGLFAGSGVGKSTLIGQIARHSTAEVVVCCLIGERGREVLDFIEKSLGPDGMKKSVIVCATSDEPALVRKKVAAVATSIAEWFRDQGTEVLLIMDSLTRFARAQREIGLAIGEPPTRQGYPPSVFSELPKLLERAGNSNKGSITAIYTVLIAGSDMEEPIADEVRGILDGHIVLDRNLAERGHWPAINILSSLSRLMPELVSKNHLGIANKIRKTLSVYEKQRDLILLGAYPYGSDPEIDYAIDFIPSIELFLQQDLKIASTMSSTLEHMLQLFAER